MIIISYQDSIRIKTRISILVSDWDDHQDNNYRMIIRMTMRLLILGKIHHAKLNTSTLERLNIRLQLVETPALALGKLTLIDVEN